MTPKVVDVGIVTTLLFNDPYADEIADYLEGYELMAPAIIRHEIDCICLERIKGDYQGRQRYLVALALLDSLCLNMIGQSNGVIVDYASRYEMSITEASYHYLCETFNADLLTLSQYLTHCTES